MKAKTKRMNFVVLVWDVVAGVMTDKDVAAKHGLTKTVVEKLRKCEGRPCVVRWIKRWQIECQGNDAMRLSLMRRSALDTMAKAMGGEASSTSLSAAKEFLNHMLGNRWTGQDADAAKASAEPRPVLDLTGLPRKLKLQVLRALGGPTDLDPPPAADKHGMEGDGRGLGRDDDSADDEDGDDADDEFDFDDESEDDQP
jgi:hypothetical protein